MPAGAPNPPPSAIIYITIPGWTTRSRGVVATQHFGLADGVPQLRHIGATVGLVQAYTGRVPSAASSTSVTVSPSMPKSLDAQGSWTTAAALEDPLYLPV